MLIESNNDNFINFQSDAAGASGFGDAQGETHSWAQEEDDDDDDNDLDGMTSICVYICVTDEEP